MEEKQTNNYERKIETIKGYIIDKYPKLSYHGIEHALDVYNSAKKYAIITNLDLKDRLILESAALFHDIIVVPGLYDNEEKSAEFAGNYLSNIGYSDYEIEKIKKLILATKMPQNPIGILEGLICDSDLGYLGRADFFIWGKRLRQELGLEKNYDWYQKQLDFLKNHKYHTKIARELNDSGKEENIKVLEKILGDLKC